MEGDQDRTASEPGGQPTGATIKSPDGNAHQEISDRQPTISEKVLVDRINRSDFWMIVLTAAIAFSGIVSAVIFGWQLIAMNGQLNEMRATREGGDKSMADQLAVMRDQTKAMLGQVAITQQEMADTRQTQRAFITVSDYVITKASGDNGKASCWNFQPVITNAGGSSTVDMRYFTEVIYKIRPLPQRPGAANSLVSAPSDPDILFRRFVGTTGLLGPKQTLPAILPREVCLTADDIPYVFAPEAVYARGAIHYRDTFPGSAEHVTKYCFWIRAIEDNGTYKPLPVLCSNWNCADEECQRDKETYEQEVAEAFAKSGEPVQAPLEYSH